MFGWWRRRRLLRWLVPTLALFLLASAVTAYALTLTEQPDKVPYTRAAQPVVDENRLIDRRTGREFVPQGVNWSSFEYACAQGRGLSSLDTLNPSDSATDPARSEAEAIASWGANTVRLPLNQDCWLGTRGAPVSDKYDERTVADYRKAVGDFVTALNDEDLVVVLDLHSRKRVGTATFGNLAMPDPESIAFWTSLAGIYRDNPSVMFDAFNEPYSRYDATGEPLFDLTWPCWRDGGCKAPVEDDQTPTNGRTTYPVQGMDRIVRAIRDAGAQQPILLGGLDYANDLSHWLQFAPDDDQLVASFHSYDFRACDTRACWDSVIAPLSDSVPVITTELGATAPLDGYVKDYLDWASEHTIGSLFWVWADHNNDPMSLIAGADGQSTAYGAFVKSRLRGD